MIVFVLVVWSGVATAQQLNILYSANLKGELEPCGCSEETDVGGMPRFAAFVRDNLDRLSPLIVVDAGNFSADTDPQGLLKTSTLLKIFSTIGYDVVAIQRRDESVKVQKRDGPVFLSNSPPFPRSIQIRKASVDVNISVDPGALKPESFNILLTDLSLSEAGQLNGWDVIILASDQVLDRPVRSGDTIIVSGYPEGKRFGLLQITLASGSVLSFRHEWIVLGRGSKEDPVVKNLILEYNRKVAGLLPRGKSQDSPYVGVSGCVRCHRDFVKSWQKTSHARAFSSLKRINKHMNPECVSCHTVGFSRGGFQNLSDTPELVDVQCESCHGPARGHLEDFYAPMTPVTEDTCRRCHTPENSPGFNYPVYLEKIKH